VLSAAAQQACIRRARATAIGVAVCGLASCLASCAWLPAAGPTVSNVVSEEVKGGRYQFDLIDVNQHVVDTIAAQPIATFHSRFSGSGLPREQAVSVGDVIGVTIYQAIDASINGQPPGNNSVGQSPSTTGLGNILPATVVPDQLVMRDGTIVVPYGGRIRLVGKTVTKAEEVIEVRLKNQLVKPQVIVSIRKSDVNTVTVSGEGASGSRVQLSPEGTRLLDVIASAGGVKSPTYQVVVRLTRGEVTAALPFDVLAADPDENIYAHPGDVITLTFAPPTFDSLGATGKPMQYPWGADKVTLAQALAMTSGLDDTKADPAGVFLMRYEPLSLVRQLIGSSGAPADAEGYVPVVFRFDMSNADAYLLAQRFAMRDKDTIYVAGAELNAVQKLVNLIATASVPVFTGYTAFHGFGTSSTAVITTPSAP
jgi:polysaccharide biosynthesis/export protein